MTTFIERMKEMLKELQEKNKFVSDTAEYFNNVGRIELLTELISKAKQEEGEGMTAKEVLLKYFPTNEYMHPPIPVGEIPKLIEAMEFYASQPTSKGERV